MADTLSAVALLIAALASLIGAIVQLTREVRGTKVDGARPPITEPGQSQRAENGRTGGRSPRGRRRRRLGTIVLLALIFVVSCAAFTYIVFIKRTRPELTITSPTEGSLVDLHETIRGTSRGLPRHDSIWVVIHIPGDSIARYFPQDHPAGVQPGGEWNSSAQLGRGEDTGMELAILAVTANEPARAAFRAYLEDGRRRGRWDGLERLPDGVTEYDRVAVTRR